MDLDTDHVNCRDISREIRMTTLHSWKAPSFVCFPFYTPMPNSFGRHATALRPNTAVQRTDKKLRFSLPLTFGVRRSGSSIALPNRIGERNQKWMRPIKCK